MALKRGDKGYAVISLQKDLIELGYPLPRWGADGDLGGESLDAFAHFMRDHGAEVDIQPELISDEELELVQRALAPRETAKPDMIDRRPFTGLGKDMGPRTWQGTTGWCLHQTACHLGSATRIDRCDNVGAHFVVYQDGRIFWLHDLNRMIVHGNGWNTRTIGIEIDGLFAGIEGESKTVWDDPSTPYREKAMTLTPIQAAATMALIRWGTAEVAAHGGKVTKLVSHRQASNSRRNDPGSKVWQEIALPLSAELGFDDGGAGFKIGSGYPNPVEWDPSRTDYKY